MTNDAQCKIVKEMFKKYGVAFVFVDMDRVVGGKKL